MWAAIRLLRASRVFGTIFLSYLWALAWSRLWPRRYDTKFFAAALPVGQEARHVSGEADEVSWLTPGAAIAEAEAGGRPMLPPTLHTLGQLQPFTTVVDALAGSPPEPLHPISPTFEKTPEGSWAVLPDGTRVRLVAPLPH